MNIANYLSLLDATAMPLNERLLEGGKVFLIGMVTVFAVLALLWLVMALFRVLFHKKNTDEDTANVIKVDTSLLWRTFRWRHLYHRMIHQLIAVITAAIAAYNASAGNALPFRVVSYRRSAGAGGWNGAAEDESI